MSNKKYEPCQLFSWWSWYWYGEPGTIDESHLPRGLFDLLRGGKPYEYYRRDYPTREAALADLAQAQAALAREQEQKQEGQTVTTTTETQTTQGEPIDVSKVQPRDVVLLKRTHGKGELIEMWQGEVLGLLPNNPNFLRLKCGDSCFDIYAGKSAYFPNEIFLLHRPPRLREISKDELIESTPIGTRVVLAFPDESGQKAGAATKVFRDHVGWAVAIDRATVYYLDDIKAIYTEEVQG